MSDLEDRFVIAIREAYSRTRSHKNANRSTKRIKALHGWIVKEIKGKLGEGYDVIGLSDGHDSSEEKVEGRYYPKKVDVCVKQKEEVKGIISVKFVNSNYKQNANNYFENLMGETANLYMKKMMIMIDHNPQLKHLNVREFFERFTNFILNFIM